LSFEGVIAEMVHAAKVEVRRWLRALEDGEEATDADEGLRQHNNGKHFLETPIEDWLLTCGHFCVVKPETPYGGLWSEPRHQDGGASVLHLGLTLWGHRDCVFEEIEGIDRKVLLQGGPRDDLSKYSTVQ
jgi:hypothetical protein